MPSSDPSERPDVLTRRQMTELAVSAISALQEAGFVDEIDVLCERVFRLPPDRLFDSEPGRGQTWTLTYKPMVELLLLHVRDAARADSAPEYRRAEILWALEAGGF